MLRYICSVATETTRRSGREYVSLGSSFTAGPGISPRALSRPRRAGQSLLNYPHLLAGPLGLDLVDVSSSGATVADVRTTSQLGQPPQIETLTPSTDLVTLTVGGNDLGYVGSLYAAFLPRWARRVPLLGGRLVRAAAPASRIDRREHVTGAVAQLLADVQARAPRATVVCVDYLTVLPFAFRDDLPIDASDHARLLDLAADLNGALAEAAHRHGVALIAASERSADHHAWSAEPWTTGWSRSGPSSAFHPNPAGMAEVSTLLRALLDEERERSDRD